MAAQRDDSSAAEAAESPARDIAGGDHPGALPDDEFDRVVEALLFASPSPLPAARLAALLGEVSPRRVRAAVERLRAEYAGRGRAFDIREIAGGYRVFTRPEFDSWVERLEKDRAPEKLSPAALETLAIVAYRQPIGRADVDAVRGVQSGPILRALKERKLIRVVGRSDQPGRPVLYGTTKRFLDLFGLSSLRDLPKIEDLGSS